MKTTVQTMLFSIIALVGFSLLLSSCECNCDKKVNREVEEFDVNNLKDRDLSKEELNTLVSIVNANQNYAAFALNTSDKSTTNDSFAPGSSGEYVPLDNAFKNVHAAINDEKHSLHRKIKNGNRVKKEPIKYWAIHRDAILSAMKYYAGQHEINADGLAFYPAYDEDKNDPSIGYHSLVFGPILNMTAGKDGFVLPFDSSTRFYNLVEPCPTFCEEESLVSCCLSDLEYWDSDNDGEADTYRRKK